MRRCLLVLLALAAVAALSPARAGAATPCRDKIFNEWYHDGEVASTYPIACYRDALKHIPADVAVYSSLSDDIRLAMQAAIERSHGQTVPKEVGAGTSRLTSSGGSSSSSGSGGSPSTGTGTTSTSTTKTSTTKTDTAPTSPDPGTATTTPTVTSQPVAASTTSGSSGVPLPVIVLGGVAIALLAAGAIGLGVRRYRRGHSV
jgi:cobalamin biosynthesis Mg chelatase CobN